MSNANAERRTVKERIIIGSIIVVAILLIVTICLLLSLPGRKSGSTSVSGNIIRPSGEVIRLKNIDSPESARLNAENMLPGDCEEKTYYIEIKESGIQAFRFKAEIASESAALSDVLMISVTVNGAEDALYNGLVKDMPESLRAMVGNDPQNNEFKISVFLDAAAPNEHQDKDIMLDFKWWVEDSDYISGSTTGNSDKCCPWCFGACPWCWILLLLLVLILVIIIGILAMWFIFRKKKMQDAAKTGTTLSSKDIGLAALFGSIGIGASWVMHKIFSREDKKDKK